MATKLLVDEGREHLRAQIRDDLSRYYAVILHIGDEGAPPSGSKDDKIAEFCYNECSDWLTGDKKAYVEVLEVSRIREARISKWKFDEKSDQQMYLIRMH